MKKIICFLIVVLMLFGCVSQSTETLQIQGIKTITYEELIQNLNSNVRFILYIGRPDCGDCEEFYPILKKYVDDHEGRGIYYLNIKEFRDQAKAEDASQEEKDFYERLNKELHFEWTPTIHEISNGKFIKTYQYLNEEYYEIKDKQQQLEKKQMFIKQFQMFMDGYFKEDA